MGVNVNRLKGLIVEKNTTQEAVANEIGMDRSTFYRRMKTGGNDFSVGEVQRIAKAIPLTDAEAIEIFFSPRVALTLQNKKAEEKQEA